MSGLFEFIFHIFWVSGIITFVGDAGPSFAAINALTFSHCQGVEPTLNLFAFFPLIHLAPWLNAWTTKQEEQEERKKEDSHFLQVLLSPTHT